MLSFFATFLPLRNTQAQCTTLANAGGPTIEIGPEQLDQLPSILQSAAPNTTVFLRDGTYRVFSTLYLRVAGTQLRSKSGKRGNVILDANYGSAREIVNLVASNTVLADLTLTRSLDHPIHVQPFSTSVTGMIIHNVHVIDPGQQAIKVNQNGSLYADNGTIQCSRIELTDIGRAYVRDNCYTGGIDIHQSRGWNIRDNVIMGFWCNQGLSEHGIHVWTGSRDTVAERNILIDNARGIGFGLGFQWSGRAYSDQPCTGRTNIGHYGGVIRNNFVAGSDTRLLASGDGFDVGIGLEDTCEVNVLHNSIFGPSIRSSAIEWRFSRNDGKQSGPTIVANNLANFRMRGRDGAVASESGNVTTALSTYFLSAVAGDLHLTQNASLAIDKAVSSTLTTDVDGLTRDSTPDVGASEYRTAPPPTGTPEPGQSPTPGPTQTAVPGITPTIDPIAPLALNVTSVPSSLHMSWRSKLAPRSLLKSTRLTLWVEPTGGRAGKYDVAARIASKPKAVNVVMSGAEKSLSSGGKAKMRLTANARSMVAGKIKVEIVVSDGTTTIRRKVIVSLVAP